MNRRNTMSVPAALALAAFSVSATAQPFFKGVGDLPGGSVDSYANSVSADGQTVVGESYTFFDDIQAIRWTKAGGIVGLGDFPGGNRSYAYAASANGSVIIGYGTPETGSPAFRWTKAGGLVAIAGIPGRESQHYPWAISADGQVIVGQSYDANGYVASYWTQAAGTVGLGDLAGGDYESEARGVSADGSVVVGYGTSGAGVEAFRWTAAKGMVGLGDLPGSIFHSEAHAVSADGSVVVGEGVSAAGIQAFRWTAAGGMLALGDHPGGQFESRALAASADGSVVVGAVENNGQYWAFIWTAAEGMQNIQTYLAARGLDEQSAWRFEAATGVSADGKTIVGYGYSPISGNPEGWIAYVGKAVTQTTTRASVTNAGQQANGGSTLGSVSADGSLVAFHSAASNLVAGDTNARNDVFVRNRAQNTTTRISVSTAGVQANSDSTDARITPDGRYVVFVSDATNLVAGDTNNAADTFLRDRQSGQTTRVSIATNGAQANGASARARISADGRYIVFESNATNLVAGDTNNATDVFLRDRQTGQTVRVSVNSAGVQGNKASFQPSLADSGTAVVFSSDATNLAAGDTNDATDVFIRIPQAGQTNRLSISSAAQQGNGDSFGGRISANGRYIAFSSLASNLVSDDSNNAIDALVRDRINGTTTRVSIGAGKAEGDADSVASEISSDGRYVLLNSSATNLVAGDSNNAKDAFIHDRWTLATTRAGVGATGQQATAATSGTAISPDGRFVIFNSLAGNLVAGDTGFSDVFIRDRRKP